MSSDGDTKPERYSINHPTYSLLGLASIIQVFVGALQVFSTTLSDADSFAVVQTDSEYWDEMNLFGYVNVACAVAISIASAIVFSGMSKLHILLKLITFGSMLYTFISAIMLSSRMLEYQSLSVDFELYSNATIADLNFYAANIDYLYVTCILSYVIMCLHLKSFFLSSHDKPMVASVLPMIASLSFGIGVAFATISYKSKELQSLAALWLIFGGGYVIIDTIAKLLPKRLYLLVSAIVLGAIAILSIGTTVATGVWLDYMSSASLTVPTQPVANIQFISKTTKSGAFLFPIAVASCSNAWLSTLATAYCIRAIIFP